MKTTSTLLPTKSAPALTDEGVLAATLDCLLEHVPVEMNGACSLQTLFEVLLRAASRIDSIEHTPLRVKGLPTGKGFAIISTSSTIWRA